jgi:Na+/H+ antiporter NhaC
MNALGLIAGLSAFAGIWFGHLCVRKIEYTCLKLWPPVLVAVLLGLICEYLSLQIESRWYSRHDLALGWA